MLVLTRKLGEAIAIGDDIKVVVMQIKGKQVRIGIKADSATPIYREEVYERVQIENQTASQPELIVMEAAQKTLSLALKAPKKSGIVLRKRIRDQEES
jgi:carbon storage regulator